MKPRISVIMGIYNCASTLSEALDSLINQTYKNFKIILCDDGSTDNTLEIAKSYVERNPCIILIKNEKNIKLAATLNHCLEYVDTEYVARMDGDDISLPTRFEKQVAFLDAHPEYAFVSTPMAHFDEKGVWKRGKAIDRPSSSDFKNGAPFCHAPAMIRKSAFDAIGGYTAEARVERVEDYYMWYKMYKAGFRGANLQEILYCMRDDMNAVHRRRFSDRVRGFHINLEVCKGLDIKWAYLISLKNLMKAFVPSFLAQYLRKKIK